MPLAPAISCNELIASMHNFTASAQLRLQRSRVSISNVPPAS